jgi:dihydropteroate synthase
VQKKIQLPRGRWLDVSTPVVMGVLNVTPDSFSDGGRHLDPSHAVDAALRMVVDGAAIIDVGGESTRPGAVPVSPDEECRRVVPIIEALRGMTDVAISIDTRNPEVMTAACRVGADLINDVNALSTDGALAAATESGAAVCLMHMQGTPSTMQVGPVYGDVVSEVLDFLRRRVQVCAAAGIPRRRLLIDPGFGFGKRFEDNLALLADLRRFDELGLPLLVGMSRKGMLGQLTGRAIQDRLAAGTAAAAIAVLGGAAIIRSHDVAATVDAIRVAQAVQQAAQSGLPSS